MKLLRKIKGFFKRYLLDIQFRNKINIVPEIALIVYGLISAKYSIIFYGCLAIVIVNLILKSISKKIAMKKIKQVVSNQVQNEESDNDIINL